jgi:hypothetical protein
LEGWQVSSVAPIAQRVGLTLEHQMLVAIFEGTKYLDELLASE